MAAPLLLPLLALFGLFVFMQELFFLKLPVAHAPSYSGLVISMVDANVDVPAPARARRNLRQCVDDQGRIVRMRVDDLETRMDAAEAQARAHETRLLFLEAHVKVVLRGFTAVQEFLRDLPGDFKLAKTAFIAALVAELKDKAFAEATHCIDEAEDASL